MLILSQWFLGTNNSYHIHYSLIAESLEKISLLNAIKVIQLLYHLYRMGENTNSLLLKKKKDINDRQCWNEFKMLG